MLINSVACLRVFRTTHTHPGKPARHKAGVWQAAGWWPGSRDTARFLCWRPGFKGQPQHQCWPLLGEGENRQLPKGLWTAGQDATQRGPASCWTTLTLAEAPLLVRLVVVGGGTPQSAVFPPVRGALVVLLIQEQEREVAGLPVRCAFNGGQGCKGKENMEAQAAPLLLTLSISAMSTQRHRRVICNGEHKETALISVQGRRGQST